MLSLLLCVVKKFRVRKNTNFIPNIAWTLSNNAEEVHYHSIGLVPHKVYFDVRKPLSSFRNACVIFISVDHKYREAIIGCEIDKIQSKNMTVVDIAMSDFVARYFPVTHGDCFLKFYCFDELT